MLKTRVITALVLVSVLLPAMFLLPQAYWALAVAGVIGIGAWEWGALLGWKPQPRIILGVVFGLGCALISLLAPAAIGAGSEFHPAQAWVVATYGLAGAFWFLAIPVWLNKKWPVSGFGGLLIGVLVLFPTWLAMVQLRTLGALPLLGIFAVAISMSKVCIR